MKKVILIVVIGLFVSNNACSQTHKYSYSQRTIKTNSIQREVFYILKDGDKYLYTVENEPKVIFDSLMRKETFNDKFNYGPYKFKRNMDTIKFLAEIDSVWTEFDFYILKFNEVFLIPNLFSTGFDSYNIECTLIDSSNNIIIGKTKYPVFTFSEKAQHDGAFNYRLVYVSKKNYLPLRIEYYTDRSLKKMSLLVECSNL